MATGEKRTKKRNFSEIEKETLVGEVEVQKKHDLVATAAGLPTRGSTANGNMWLLWSTMSVGQSGQCQNYKKKGGLI